MSCAKRMIIVGLVACAACCHGFEDSFEPAPGMSGTIGSIDGQNGWELLGVVANVQSNTASGGTQSMEIRQAAVQRGLAGGVESLWVSFWARITAAPTAEPTVDESQTSFAFYVNTNMHLVVYSNTVPVELGVAVPSNVWTRFDVYADYNAATWVLAQGGTNVATGLPMFPGGSQPTGLFFKNEGAASLFVDDILATGTEPEGMPPEAPRGLRVTHE